MRKQLVIFNALQVSVRAIFVIMHKHLVIIGASSPNPVYISVYIHADAGNQGLTVFPICRHRR